MAHSEYEKFYEADRQDIKLSHSDFMIEDNRQDFDDTKEGLLEYLLLVEEKYKDLLAVRDGKLDARFCNTVFTDVLSHCSNVSPVFVIDEIVAFFGLEYDLFFSLLDTYNKNRLFKALKQRVNCDTFIRQKRKKVMQSTGGCIQPTFRKKTD